MMTTTAHAAPEAATTTKKPRPAGETGDSPQRAAQRMHAEALVFDLTTEVSQLHSESSWRRGDRNAKTLVQERGLHVVLVALKPRARLAEHESHAQVTVHVVAGRVLVHLAGRTIEVFRDRLLSLEAGVAHELEALEECAFLLTIAGTRSRPTTQRALPGGTGHTATAAQAVKAAQHWADDGGRV